MNNYMFRARVMNYVGLFVFVCACAIFWHYSGLYKAVSAEDNRLGLYEFRLIVKMFACACVGVGGACTSLTALIVGGLTKK